MYINTQLIIYTQNQNYIHKKKTNFVIILSKPK